MIEGFATSIELTFKNGDKRFISIQKTGGEFYINDKVLSYVENYDSVDVQLDDVNFVRCFLYSFQVLKVTL